jgi:hypothetical protein
MCSAYEGMTRLAARPTRMGPDEHEAASVALLAQADRRRARGALHALARAAATGPGVENRLATELASDSIRSSLRLGATRRRLRRLPPASRPRLDSGPLRIDFRDRAQCHGSTHVERQALMPSDAADVSATFMPSTALPFAVQVIAERAGEGRIDVSREAKAIVERCQLALQRGEYSDQPANPRGRERLLGDIEESLAVDELAGTITEFILTRYESQEPTPAMRQNARGFAHKRLGFFLNLVDELLSGQATSGGVPLSGPVTPRGAPLSSHTTASRAADAEERDGTGHDAGDRGISVTLGPFSALA